MDKEYYDIKDKCRKGLLKYLSKALSYIRLTENPGILDAGCSSGVVAIEMAAQFAGKITAFDIDEHALKRLKEKSAELQLTGRINIINSSLLDLKLPEKSYDLIIAEGLLNVTGFENGFQHLLKFLKPAGFMIIHDEYRDQEAKQKFIEESGCKLLHTFSLDENVWRDDYYKCLEAEIRSLTEKLRHKFESGLREIETLMQNPLEFRSRYYIAERVTNHLK